jgi:D,D-heptose 1,7-bisphosphate phosphatase
MRAATGSAVAASRAVFIDKDGTLVKDVPFNVDAARIELMPGALAACAALSRAGYRLVIVSNQSGVARGFFREAALQNVRDRLETLLANAGVSLAGFYYCPHLPTGSVPEYAIDCQCRKPRPGMLRQAARDLEIDLTASWMVGDILDDVEAGRAAGCRTCLVDNGNETQWKWSPDRKPDWIVPDLHQAAVRILASSKDDNAEIHHAKGVGHDRGSESVGRTVSATADSCHRR